MSGSCVLNSVLLFVAVLSTLHTPFHVMIK